MSTLTQIHQLLAYLYGDDTIPAASDTEYLRRTSFINAVIKRLYNLREWTHLSIKEDVVPVGDTVTLSKRPSSIADVRYLQSGDDVYPYIS